MRTWTAITKVDAPPDAVLGVLTDPTAGGSEVRASIDVRPGRGFRGRVLAEATNALLKAGALNQALSRIGREVAACPA